MKTRISIYLFGLVLVFGLLLVFTSEGGQESVLVLSESNTVSFRLPVSDVSVKQAGAELIHKSHALRKSSSLFLVLNSPGGDIDAGNQLIEIAKGLPQKVNTVSLFSASMSFIISQNLATRYVMDSSTLMSHRAYARGLEGQVPGNLLSRTMALVAGIARLEEGIASRAGLSLPDYQHLIIDELWMGGARAVEMKFADKLVRVRCDKSLDGPGEEETLDLFFIKAHIVFHKCPLITAPLSIKIEGNIKDDKDKNAQKALMEALWDRTSFVNDYVQSGKYFSTVR